MNLIARNLNSTQLRYHLKVNKFTFLFLILSGCISNPNNREPLEMEVKHERKINAADDYIAENKINASDDARVSVINHGSYISIDNSINLDLGINYTDTNINYKYKKTNKSSSELEPFNVDIDEILEKPLDLNEDNSDENIPQIEYKAGEANL